MTKSIIDEIGRKRAMELISEATINAAAKSKKLGLPEAVEIAGVWCKKYPDGRIEPILIPDVNNETTYSKRHLHQA